MEGCRPADFYESYKQLYAKAIELNKCIYEAEGICAEICDDGACICGGEDCRYSNLRKAEAQLASLIKDKANLIRKMETVIKDYKIALETDYLKIEIEKNIGKLAKIKLALKLKELESAVQPEINAVQKAQSH